ncbi:phosphotransferase [Longispora albida]|uniref:phosphotransferase n=1 Tax=Longispora albida TaxID=203523 RepID=UPI0003A86A8D|nr:phosphotransferase [Longispora albida]
MTRAFAVPGELAAVVTAALGPGRAIAGAHRLRGGSKKGVYRLALADGSTVVLYSWGADENYWPARDAGSEPGPADPFADASGLDLFTAASDRLRALGVRAPAVYFTDDTHASYPADLAIVEDVRGETLDSRLAADPAGAGPVLGRLREALALMRADTSTRIGKLARPAAGGACPDLVLRRALGDLAEAARRTSRIGEVSGQVAGTLHELAAAIGPRSEHSLVHGELGPDHVLVGPDGEPVLIDIEGLMHFDAEWEHAFLRLRFGQHYRHLAVPGLDPARMALYSLAMDLSLVSGPLRLLDGDFPDRDFMLAIAGHATGRVLAALT